jgi:hypothetical protein
VGDRLLFTQPNENEGADVEEEDFAWRWCFFARVQNPFLAHVPKIAPGANCKWRPVPIEFNVNLDGISKTLGLA